MSFVRHKSRRVRDSQHFGSARISFLKKIRNGLNDGFRHVLSNRAAIGRKEMVAVVDDEAECVRRHFEDPRLGLGR